MDSRARECENPAYFVILAQNCDLGAPTIPQSTDKWRIFVSFVRIVVLFSTILVVNFRSFPLISVDHVVRDLTETSILLAETVNACAYAFLLSLSLTQDGVEIYSFLACDNYKRQEIGVGEAETSGATAPECFPEHAQDPPKRNQKFDFLFRKKCLENVISLKLKFIIPRFRFALYTLP